MVRRCQMTQRTFIQNAADRVLFGDVLAAGDCLRLTAAEGPDLYLLFAEASRIREYFKGNSASLCSIINAKSGRCPENCAFCSQSAFHKTNAQVYPLVDEEQIVACAKSAEQNGARCYGIITSGTGIKPGEELERICRSLRRIRSETTIDPSCSLGILDFETAQ